MTVSQKGSAGQRAASISLLALAFVQLASSAVSPALANMSQAFPDVSPALIGMLSTLPSFLGIPCTLVCGKIVGQKVSYRTLANLGMVVSLVCGIAPAFTNSFALDACLACLVRHGIWRHLAPDDADGHGEL